MYFIILKKYLSAYMFPILKKANVIKIATILKNIIVFAITDILKDNIPTDIILIITYIICLNDRYPPKYFFFVYKIKWYFI